MIKNIPNMVIKCENLFCIYRNYVNFNKWVRALAVIRMLIETSISIYFLYGYYDYYYLETVSFNIYFIVCHTVALMIIFIPWLKSRDFMKAVSYLDTNANSFKTDPTYNKCIKNKVFTMKVIMGAYILTRSLNFIFTRVFNTFKVPILSDLYMTCVELYLSVNELRFALEFLHFSWLLMVVSGQLRFIIHDIDSRCTLVVHTNLNNIGAPRLCPIKQVKISDINIWNVAYTRITESMKLFNIIFGIQITIMLTTSLLYHVSLAYSMTASSVKEGDMKLNRYLSYTVTLTHHACLVSILGICAQSAQTSAELLKRRLSKLLIDTQDSDSNHTALRDLIRLVGTRTIQAQSFGSIDINMTLLPTCMALFASYTVIALQFNNIV